MYDQLPEILRLRKQPSQARSRARVEKIMMSTVELLRSEGLNAVNTNRIAQQAGIPVGSVYQYFPNKLAVLSELYLGQLQRIRVRGLELEKEVLERGGPWQDCVEYYFRNIKKSEESERGLMVELVRAITVYPELQEIDWINGEMTAKHLASMLSKLGSQWPQDRLERLALFTYSMDSASWAYNDRSNAPDVETIQWEINAAIGALSPCFESQ